MNTFEDVMCRTRSQLTECRASSLSPEGRATMIKANLSVKPNYLMQSFMLPTEIHKERDQINRTFIWNKNHNFKPLIGWDKIYIHIKTLWWTRKPENKRYELSFTNENHLRNTR